MRLVFRPNEAGRRIAYSRARATVMTMAKAASAVLSEELRWDQQCGQASRAGAGAGGGHASAQPYRTGSTAATR